jgi:hypothetical protein
MVNQIIMLVSGDDITMMDPCSFCMSIVATILAKE